MSTPAPILQYTLSDATMKGLLPAGYTPLAYIESSGTQWIDSGIALNSSNSIYRFECKVGASTRDGHSHSFFGTSSYLTGMMGIYHYNTNNYYSQYILGSAKGTTNFVVAKGDIIEYYLLMNMSAKTYASKIAYKNEVTGSFTAMSNTTDTIRVFKSDDFAGGYWKCYYFRITKDNVLQVDLVPCIQESNGAIGMYDLVSRSFKANAGSGTFIAGPPLAVGKGGGKSLPEEYLLVEYLEGKIGQYIDTGYTHTTNTKMEFTFELNVSDNNWHLFFGTRGSGSTHAFTCHYKKDTSTFSPTLGENRQVSLASGFELNKRFTLIMDNTDRSCKLLNSSLVQVASGTSDGSLQTGSYSMAIMACKQGDSSYDYLTAGKIFRFKISESGSYKRDMFPCYRKSDMKPGMYDVVNGVFYTNAGSGEFILGPSITNYYTCEPNAGETPNLCVELYGYNNKEVTLNDYNNTGSFTLFLNSSFAISDYSATVGKTYTISFDAISPNGTSELLLYNTNGNPRYFYYSKGLGNVTTSWQHYSYTFTSSDRGSGNAVSHPVEIYAPSKMKVRIRNLRVSEGSIDWNANKRQGLYTNVSGIYDSSKGWVADLTSNSRYITATIPNLGNNFSVVWWELSSEYNGGTMPWGIGNFNPLYSKCLNNGDGSSNPWYKPGTTTAIDNITNNIWHYFVVTGNGSANYLYVDGVKYGLSKTFKGLTGTSLVINGWQLSTSYCRNPKIFNFQIFNVALTDAQVKELYGK